MIVTTQYAPPSPSKQQHYPLNLEDLNARLEVTPVPSWQINSRESTPCRHPTRSVPYDALDHWITMLTYNSRRLQDIDHSGDHLTATIEVIKKASHLLDAQYWALMNKSQQPKMQTQSDYGATITPEGAKVDNVDLPIAHRLRSSTMRRRQINTNAGVATLSERVKSSRGRVSKKELQRKKHTIRAF